MPPCERSLLQAAQGRTDQLSLSAFEIPLSGLQHQSCMTSGAEGRSRLCANTCFAMKEGATCMPPSDYVIIRNLSNKKSLNCSTFLDATDGLRSCMEWKVELRVMRVQTPSLQDVYSDAKAFEKQRTYRSNSRA